MSEGVSIDEFTAELKRMSNGKDLITLEEFLEYSHKVLSVHRDDLEKQKRDWGEKAETIFKIFRNSGKNIRRKKKMRFKMFFHI